MEMRARLARELGLPPERWGELSDRTESPSEVATNIVNLLRRSRSHEAADKASRKAESLEMDAHLRGQRRSSPVVVDAADMNELIRGLSGGALDAA
jgi:hypothetical protein